MKSFNYKKLYNYNSSFQLIRTNPKLTGNVKMTVDSKGDVWLNSIKANEILADDIFQKNPVDIQESFSTNLMSFFKQNDISYNKIFENNQPLDLTIQSFNFNDQYSFGDYYSSVRYSDSRFYDEYFAAFAPLYIKGDVPQYYVVFRIEGALDENLQSLNKDRNPKEIMQELLKRSKIIKSFDLSRNTKIGKFLWEIVDEINLNETELSVDFDTTTIVWNGYSLTNGAISGHSSFEPEMFEEGQPIKDFENFIVSGYERTGILYPHIINMEFVFDDVESEFYDFNRYMGMYVNEIELNKLTLDYNGFLKEHNITNYDKYKDYYFYDEVKNTTVSGEFIKLPVEKVLNDFHLSDVQRNIDNPIISVLEDKDNNLHSIKYENGLSFENDTLVSVSIDNRNATIDKLFGVKQDFLQIEAITTDRAGHGHTYVKFLDDLHPGDSFKLYHYYGSHDEGNGKFDLIEIAESAYLSKPGDSYYYIIDKTITTTPPIDNNVYQFYGKGQHTTMYKNAEAFAHLLNNIPFRSFETFVFEDYVFIKMINPGDTVNVSVEFASSRDDYDSVEIYEKTGTELVDTKFPLFGNTRNANRIIFDNEHVQYITDNLEKLYIKTQYGISKIKEISKYIDVINSRVQDFETYFSKSVLILENSELPEIYNGYLYLLNQYDVPVKLLSFRNLKDFDFGFYSERYNKFPVWELYKYYSIPADLKLLKENTYYKVVGEGEINYYEDTGTAGIMPKVYKSNQGKDSVFLALSDAQYFTIEKGFPIVIYSDIDVSENPINNNPLFDKNNDITGFTGFFGLRDISVNVNYKNVDDYNYNKRFYEHMLKSEYNAYRENFSVNYAQTSRITPYICKWGYVNGTDSRDNPYRLNAHSVFGLSNISPDFNRYVPDVNSLTHEWFYMVSNYDFIYDDSIRKLNYTHFLNNYNFNLSQNTRISEPSFLDYFYYNVTDKDGNQIAPAQQRFSFIKYNNDTNLSETFFKGIKFVFYETETDEQEFVDNSRFDKYRFTILLQPIEETINEDQSPFTLEFIENQEGMFIILLIKLYIGSDSTIDETVDDINENNYRSVYTDPSVPHVDGDYKISFDNGISDLTHLFFYGVDHKKFNNKLDRFSTIKIPAVFKFRAPSDPVEVNSLFVNYVFDLTDFLSFKKPVNYLKSVIGNSNPAYLNIKSVGGYDSKSPLKQAHSNLLFLDTQTGDTDTIVFTNTAGSVIGTLPVPVEPTNVTQIKGGKDYFNKIFSKLSFANVKDLINKDDPSIIFKNVLHQDRSFKVRILNPDRVHKYSELKAEVSEYKPKGYENYPVTSFDISTVDLTQNYALQRYSGNYEPVFNEVLQYKRTFGYKNVTNAANYNNIEVGNVEFLINYENFAILPEFGHMKVSDKSVLSLDDDKNKNSYDIIDETAIGNKPFIFIKSDWDWNYHHKYTSKSESNSVPGTFRLEDDNAFINKKLVLPKEIYLLDYDLELVTDTRILNVFNLEEHINYNFQSIYTIGDNTKIAFNIIEIFTKILMDNGVWENIQKYLPDDISTLNGVDLYNFTKLYLKENIVDLFEMDIAELYVKKVSKDNVTTIIIPDSTTDVKILINQGFNLKKDAQINKNDISTIIIENDINYNYVIYPFIKMKLV